MPHNKLRRDLGKAITDLSTVMAGSLTVYNVDSMRTLLTRAQSALGGPVSDPFIPVRPEPETPVSPVVGIDPSQGEDAAATAMLDPGAPVLVNGVPAEESVRRITDSGLGTPCAESTLVDQQPVAVSQ